MVAEVLSDSEKEEIFLFLELFGAKGAVCELEGERGNAESKANERPTKETEESVVNCSPFSLCVVSSSNLSDKKIERSLRVTIVVGKKISLDFFLATSLIT